MKLNWSFTDRQEKKKKKLFSALHLMKETFCMRNKIY